MRKKSQLLRKRQPDTKRRQLLRGMKSAEKMLCRKRKASPMRLDHLVWRILKVVLAKWAERGRRL